MKEEQNRARDLIIFFAGITLIVAVLLLGVLKYKTMDRLIRVEAECDIDGIKYINLNDINHQKIREITTFFSQNGTQATRLESFNESCKPFLDSNCPQPERIHCKIKGDIPLDWIIRM